MLEQQSDFSEVSNDEYHDESSAISVSSDDEEEDIAEEGIGLTFVMLVSSHTISQMRRTSALHLSQVTMKRKT